MTLIRGKIPAHTKCPFHSRCAFVVNDTCNHTGVNHPVAFSCAAARAYALIDCSPSIDKVQDMQ